MDSVTIAGSASALPPGVLISVLFARFVELFRDQRTIVYVGLATFLLTLGQGTAIPVVPLFGNELGMTTTQVGFAVSAFAAARVFTNVPSAIISDRIGRRWVLIAGGLFAAVGNLLSFTADSLLPLMAFRFIAGIGSGAFITVGVAATADLSTPANRARLMSVFQWSFIAGITVGPTVGGVVADLFGIRAPFLVVGIVSAMSALWTLLMVPETRVRQQPADVSGPMLAQGAAAGDAQSGDRRETGFSRFDFMFSRGFLLIMLIFIGVFFARGGALFNLLPLIAKNDLGLSETGVGLMQTLPALASLFVLPFVGTLSDRYGRKSVIVPGMAVLAVCLAVLGFSSTALVFGMGMVMYGISQGMEGPAPLAYVSDISPDNRQAMAQGMARTLGDIALMSAAPILGAISDAFGNTEALFGTGIIMAVIMVIFLVFAKETAGRRRTESTTP